MRFGQLEYAYGFWLIPLLVLFFFLRFRNKTRLLRNFAQDNLLNELAASVNFKRQIVKFSLLLGVWFLSILALMRPQWGFHWEEVKRRGLDILIAIDTSKSMLASDVQPNRLARSKLAVKDLVRKLQGDRIGLIAFAGSAFLQCPLTVDYGGFLLALDDLSVETIPRGGTAISSAIKEALRGYEGPQKQYKVLVIITDGEDHEGNALAAAEVARAKGIKIFCIGIGTPEGELIQLTDASGQRSFLKDREGNIVKSRLNEELLQKVALTTGGLYLRSSGAEFGLDYIYEEKLAKMEKREIEAKMSKNYHERFQLPLALAVVLLVLEPLLSDRKRR